MKDVSDQQVAEHLKQLNPWWRSGRMVKGRMEDFDTLIRDNTAT